MKFIILSLLFPIFLIAYEEPFIYFEIDCWNDPSATLFSYSGEQLQASSYGNYGYTYCANPFDTNIFDGNYFPWLCFGWATPDYCCDCSQDNSLSSQYSCPGQRWESDNIGFACTGNQSVCASFSNSLFSNSCEFMDPLLEGTELTKINLYPAILLLRRVHRDTYVDINYYLNNSLIHHLNCQFEAYDPLECSVNVISYWPEENYCSYDYPYIDFYRVFIADTDYYYYGSSKYKYGEKNKLSININSKGSDIEGYCISDVGILLFYRYKPLVRFIQAVDGAVDPQGTQLIYDYKEKENVKNIIYETKLKNDGTIDNVNSFVQPIVVPYSQDPSNPRIYKLNIKLYGVGIATDEDRIRANVSYIYGKGKAIPIQGQFYGREFTIELPAPAEVGSFNLKLNFSFEMKIGEPENWNQVRQQTITIPVYTILDFSKQFASNPNPKYHLPSKDIISMALGYIQGAKTEELSMARLTEGIYNNSKHKYDSSRQYYTTEANTECNPNASFEFKKYLKQINNLKNNEKLSLDCLDTSFLLYILSRAIGIDAHNYGLDGPIPTIAIKPMGFNSWITTNWEFHQTNLRNENVYDATVKVKENENDRKGIYVINMEKQTYSQKITGKQSYIGSNCSDPALNSIIYKLEEDL